jgi:alkyl hydroperoxide reductase subunit D
MTIEQLKEKLPEHAKDIRLNLSNLFGNVPQSGLTDAQFYGTALAVAYSLQDVDLVAAIKNEIDDSLISELDVAAKTAATLMAMNNIYYRFVHLAEDAEFSTMPANLRMSGLRSHGVEQGDFELFALAVSAINGCGLCISSHVQQLSKHGVSKPAIQTSIRLAATLNAAVQALRM